MDRVAADVRRLICIPRIMPPTAALADVVEAFLDWEVPDRRLTASLTAKSLPCPAPQLCVHYRSTAWTNRRRSAGFYRQIAIGIQTEVATDRAPTGALGMLITRLKPEAAVRLIGVPLPELTNSSAFSAPLRPPCASENSWLGETPTMFLKSLIMCD